MKRIMPCGTTPSNFHKNKNNASTAGRRFLTFLLASPLLSPSSSQLFASACNFYYGMSCQGGYPYTATTTLTIRSSGSYEAIVTYHWTKANTPLGSISLNGEETLDDVTYEFYELDEYYAGATVTWGSGSGCEGSTSDSFSLITFSGSSCNIEDDVTPPDYLLENGITSNPRGDEGGISTAVPTMTATEVREGIVIFSALS